MSGDATALAAAAAASEARAAAFEKRVSDVFGYFKEIKSTHLKSSGNDGEYTSGFLGAIYSLGLSEPSPKDWHAWSAIMDTIDSNGVGTLSFEDFRFIVEQQQEKVPTSASLMDAFSTFEEVRRHGLCFLKVRGHCHSSGC